MQLLDHSKNCRRVLFRDFMVTELVKSVRQACMDATTRATSAGNPVTPFARQELKAFRAEAAATIDKHLKAASNGTPASAIPINQELLHFVSAVSPNIRLSARAGSGKSTALVIKVDFLVKELALDPNQIQIVTFNTAAAETLAERLCKALGPDVGKRIRVNTFHSLAYHLVKCHPKTTKANLLFGKEDDLGDRGTKFLARSTRAVVTPDDFVRLRKIYKNSEWSWKTQKDDFDGDLLEMLPKAALLYRARCEGVGTEQHTEVGAILSRICAHHEACLTERNELDFEAAVRKAADLLDALDSNVKHRSALVSALDGNTRFLMIDEFQDFSPAFQRLVAAIMRRNPYCVLNAVGDDWQAINGFMGSNPKYFKGFRQDWAPALNLPLRANWRCGERVVALGNAVMEATKDKAAVAAQDHAGKIWLPREGKINTKWRRREEWQEEASAYVVEQVKLQTRYTWDEEAKAGRTPGTLALIASENCPYGTKPEAFVQTASREWTAGKVEFVTAHSAKGREWDHVILLDAIAERYPSKHPANVLIKGMRSDADLEAEAQRLLYVAVTRAKHSLVLLAPTELHPRLAAARELSRR